MLSKNTFLATAAIFTSTLGLAAEEWKPNTIPPGYEVETLETPDTSEFAVVGVDFLKDGSLVVCTRTGDVWVYPRAADHYGDLDSARWRKFADGLHEPVGLYIDPETDEIFVVQKPELTQLIDGDDDGVADFYRSVSAGWGFSGNYHEYAFGLVRDDEGNFYGTLNLAHGGRRVRNSTMGSGAPYRGWAFKVTPEGEFVPYAKGMRSPAGLGMNKEGDIFYTDNQGDFIATSWLAHVKKGAFYGHPASLWEDPKFADRNLDAVPLEELDAMRTRPAVFIPHAEVANSPGNPEWDYTGGDFGPFSGQAFIGDQTKSNIFRVSLEKVGGEYQGSLMPFIDHLQSGIIRLEFGPDGRLYVGQTARGWGAIGGKMFGLQRVGWDGETIPFEIKDVSLTEDGFVVNFTKPVDATVAGQAANWNIKRWHYKYHNDYGSPKIDERQLPVRNIRVARDGMSVRFDTDLAEKHIYHITTSNLASKDGESLTNNGAYYTANRLR